MSQSDVEALRAGLSPMSRARTTLPVGLVVALVLAGVGCGGDETTTTTTPPAETPQALPKLPKRWRAHADRSIGYRIGIPPGWQVSRSRTGWGQGRPDPLAGPPGRRHPGGRSRPRGAGGAAGRVRDQRAGGPAGVRDAARAEHPAAVRGTPFDAVHTAATGTTKARGIKERTTLLVLRREGIVNYTVAIVQNARRRRSAKARAVALKMMHTLRDQPVGPAAPTQ